MRQRSSEMREVNKENALSQTEYISEERVRVNQQECINGTSEKGIVKVS